MDILPVLCEQPASSVNQLDECELICCFLNENDIQFNSRGVVSTYA